MQSKVAATKVTASRQRFWSACAGSRKDKKLLNDTLALHTAARRYCLERYRHWCNQYGSLCKRGGDRQPDGHHYTEEALRTFPRYNILNAIRIEVERHDPAMLGDLASAKEKLIRLGETASDEFTCDPIGPIAESAIAEERAAFRAYMERLTLSALASTEPLPYRRVLSVDEAAAIWSRLREHWRITHAYWFPLAGPDLAGVMAFQAEAFRKAVSTDRLIKVLKQRKVERVWELREHGPEYEQDVSLWDPKYNGAEGYWSSESLDWIVYASHESSVTIGGWLLFEIQSIWPRWKDHQWSGPY